MTLCFLFLEQKLRPNVTNMFNTWVECVIVNKNQTTDVHEYFDADHNRGFIEQIDDGELLNKTFYLNI